MKKVERWVNIWNFVKKLEELFLAMNKKCDFTMCNNINHREQTETGNIWFIDTAIDSL